jgi:hypothetical protein
MCYNADTLEHIGTDLGQDLSELMNWANETYHLIFGDFNILGLIDYVTIFELEL